MFCKLAGTPYKTISKFANTRIHEMIEVFVRPDTFGKLRLSLRCVVCGLMGLLVEELGCHPKTVWLKLMCPWLYFVDLE